MAEQKTDPFDLASGVPEIGGTLRPKPKFADRISRRVLFLVFGFVAVLLVIFFVSLNHMDEKKKSSAEAKEKTNEGKADKDIGSSVPNELKGVAVPGNAQTVDMGEKPPKAGSLVDQVPNTPSPAPAVVADGTPTMVPGMAGVDAVPPMGSSAIPKANETSNAATPPPLTPQQQAVAQAKQDRLTRLAQARSNGMLAKGFDSGDTPSAGGVESTNPNTALLNGINSALAQAAKNPGAMPPAGGATSGQAASEQDEKMNFMKEASKDDRSYHPYTPLPAISANELKVGSFIPLVLETGINSDLPGEITARSSEAIYDSVSGCRLLIPAMTKFVGKYDSKVALGQGRMLVVWNSAIFPDGEELNLAGMQGYDSSGQAGLPSDVNNHYMRLFGIAFGMSMVTAGVQLSVPTPPSVNGSAAAPTVGQTVSTALAQQYGQLGAQILSKYANVQPTLRNYPGERFTIMVPHTIVFKKVWANRCSIR